MTSMTDWFSNNVSDVVMDDAASWMAILDSERCNMSDRVAFAQWLDEDPSHRWAFEELSEVWAKLRILNDVEPLLQQPNVVPFPSVNLSTIPRTDSRQQGPPSEWSTMVVALLVGIGSILHFALASPSDEFITGVGESRDVALSDGSMLELNTRTSMLVSIDEQQRRVELLDGEAVFHVAHDSRPFVVATEYGDVVALGTSFIVEINDGSLEVSVIEGQVSVTTNADQAPLIDYDATAGHQFSAADYGLELKISAPTTDALNLLQIEAIPDLGAIEGVTKLIVSRDAVGFYGADLNIGSARSTAVNLQGQVGQASLHGANTVSGIDLKVDLKTTDLAGLAKIFGYKLERTAAAHIATRLTGASDNISLGQTDIRIHNKAGVNIKATGKGENVVVTDTSISANAQFNIKASASDLSAFSELAGTNLPSLGAVEASGNLVVKGAELKLDQLKINIGATDQPTIRMDGEIVTQLHKGSTVSMSYEVAVGDLAAALTGEPPGYLGRLHGAADISDFDGTWGVEKFRLKSSDTRLYDVDIGGIYKDMGKNDLIKVDAKLDINDPVALGKALGVDLSGYSAFHSEGVLTGTGDSITYTAATAVGRSASKTVVNGSLLNGRPYFKGSFELPVLYLADFGFNPKKDIDEPLDIDVTNKGSGDIFSKQPYKLDFLNSFDMDFDFLIDQVESHGELTIDSITARVRLKNGDLNIDPFKLVFEGGTADVVFGLQASGTPAIKLNMVADDVKLGPMMAQVQNDVPINGYSNIDIDITASGNSPHEMASSLNGTVSLGFENAKIPNKYIQFLSVDVLGWAVSSTFKKRKYADLNCVVGKFEADNGKVQSTVLIADGPNVSLGGSIKLNLRKETMNIVLLPKEKHKLFSSISPVKIKGPMRNPDVDALPAKAAIQEIGAMALVPYVYVPLKLMSKLWSVVDDGDEVGQGCKAVKAVTEEAEKKMQLKV